MKGYIPEEKRLATLIYEALDDNGVFDCEGANEWGEIGVIFSCPDGGDGSPYVLTRKAFALSLIESVLIDHAAAACKRR